MTTEQLPLGRSFARLVKLRRTPRMSPQNRIFKSPYLNFSPTVINIHAETLLAIRITAAREPRERTNHRVKYRISGRFQGLRLTVRLIEELSPIGWIVRDEWTHFPVPLLAHRCIRTVPLSRAVCIQHYAKLGIEIISGDDGRPVPYDDDVELIEDVRGDAGENGGMGRDFVHNDYGMRINGLELHFPPPK
jgi:hypothetical protein